MRFQAFGKDIDPQWRDIFTTPVKVTSGRSCYNPALGLTINLLRPIASYLGNLYAKTFEARLDGTRSSQPDPTSPLFKRASKAVNFSDLKISCLRTIRAETSIVSNAILRNIRGRFFLFDDHPEVEAFPSTVKCEGGVFVPMYRELAHPFLPGASATIGLIEDKSLGIYRARSHVTLLRVPH
jgi:hypothetical protein